MSGWYQNLAAFLGEDPFGFLLYHIGTFAGAISGIRLACVKRFDWFGAFVVGAVTAIGGGTLRDCMLLVHPFWMDDTKYIFTCFLAQVMLWTFGRRFITEKITWFVFDTIAISVFMWIGLDKTLQAGFDYTVAIIMGVITAVFGGVIRDVLINEVPLIFRKELYAMACAAGGVLYMILDKCGVDHRLCAIACVVIIFLLRAGAIKYGWHIPILSGRVHRMPHLGWTGREGGRTGHPKDGGDPRTPLERRMK